MSGKKRGPKPRYEEEDVLEAMAVYFYEHMVVRKEDLSVFTVDPVSQCSISQVQPDAENADQPSFSVWIVSGKRTADCCCGKPDHRDL